MAEKAQAENKGKSGAGKFFLGAALGAIVGAAAGKFLKIDMSEDDDEELDECNCGEDCKCKKEEKKAEPAKKTVPAKKTTPAKKAEKK